MEVRFLSFSSSARVQWMACLNHYLLAERRKSAADEGGRLNLPS
jgi:hypothetical protein